MPFYDKAKMLQAGIKQAAKPGGAIGGMLSRPGPKKPAARKPGGIAGGLTNRPTIKPIGKARSLEGGPMGKATDAQLAKAKASRAKRGLI